MKKFVLIFAALIGFAVSASAQVSVYASYGGYTQMDACNNHDGWDKVHTAWGALNTGVDFKVARGVKIGPSYTFSSTETDGGSNASHIAYHAVLFNVKVDYYRSGLWTLYGHGGLGVVISHMQPKWSDTYNKTYFAGQISPLGVRASLTNKFDLFAEAGFGAQGIVQLGFNINL